MLSRFQKKFIRNKIKEIGDIRQIKELYNAEDEVSKYALELAEKRGLKKTKGQVYYRIKEYKEIALDKPEVFSEYSKAEQKMKNKLRQDPKRLFIITSCKGKGK